MFKNSAGKIYYGMHFYPGVAEYREPGSEPYRVFLNENTIRRMSPTFTGKPIYVEHVDEVPEDKANELVDRKADGYVVESFYNAADGKTWAKFIILTPNAEAAIKKGWRLSNAYHMTEAGSDGQWNGVDYAKEVLNGEYEHLAIVPNPRYEESVIMTPEQFKKYNSDHETELKRLANSKDKESTKMGLGFFKKAKVENAKDYEGLCVTLKNGKDYTLEQIVTEFEKIQNMNGYANGDHMVKVGEKDEMSVNDLSKKYTEMCNEMAEMKKPKDEDEKKNDDGEDDMENADGEDDMENADDEEAKKKAAEMAEAKKNEDDEKKKDEKKENSKKAEKTPEEIEAAKKNFEKLKNAPTTVSEAVAVVDLPHAQLERGRARYGS